MLFSLSRRRRPPTLAVMAAVGLLALTGCTASHGHKQPDSGHTPTAANATATPMPTTAIGATALPTDIPNTAALRSRVQITNCTKTPGGWKADGTAANPTTKDTSYTVTIFFLATTGTVLGSGQTTPQIAAGKTVKWSVKDKFTAPAGTRCALRGVG